MASRDNPPTGVASVADAPRTHEGLTENQLEVLRGLYDLYEPGEADQRWWRLLDIGARDASHHSATAARLANRGLIERTDKLRGSLSGRRKTWMYRITPAGCAAFERAEAAINKASGADHG